MQKNGNIELKELNRLLPEDDSTIENVNTTDNSKSHEKVSHYI